MEQLLVYIALALFGLAIGSFCGATVWRLRAQQLKEDEAAGEDIDKKEYRQLKSLLKKSISNDRSICLHCHHQLAWYDLLPLVSWLQLRGKCRYCHKPIGVMEPIIELGTAVFFVASYLLWPNPIVTSIDALELGLWLTIGVGLIILFAYDARWFLLPNRVVFPLMAIALVYGGIQVFQADSQFLALYSLVIGCCILSGLYYVLYVVSRGAWVGFGDIKLGLVLALALADWKLALLTLFFANLIGCIIVLPGLLTRKLKRTSHVPFGPMLILAYFIVGLFGTHIIEWYWATLFF